MKEHFYEFLVFLLAELALGLPHQFADRAILPKPTLPCLLKCREVFRLYILQVRNAETLKKGGERLQYSGDLLDRQLRAFLLFVERSALFSKVVLNRLLHCLEGAWVELPTLGKELNHPLLDQILGS